MAGTSAFDIATDVANLTRALEFGQAAQLGGKFLIFDQYTAVVGKPATAEFLVTDGTKAGTTTFTITGTSPLPPFGAPAFQPGPFFTLGNMVLFAAADSNRLNSLWVSNGTAKGTVPLDVKDADSTPFTGLRPAGFTAFGKSALFFGQDSGHREGLWITNGTAGGTHELAQTFFNTQIAIAGSRAFFRGSDGNLWVTNGTTGGTHKLGVSAGVLTAFGNRVLDVFGSEFFVSDGTATHQFAWTGFGASNFIALGNKVLFEAGDPKTFQSTLWVTDGTAPGTHEVALKDKPFIRGLFGEISFRGAVVGNEVAFSGTDILGQTGLWESDGLSAREVVPVLSVAGLTSLPSAPASPAPPAPSGLALAKSSDSGVLGDRITKVTRPTITGKGVAGDTVRLFDGAKAVGSVKVAAGGVWFVTTASALAAGAHSLTATESGAGGTSKASAALSLTIKTSAPAPAGLSFAVAADKGPAGDTFTVAGKGEAGDTVTLFDGLKAVGSAKVAAGGGWSITTAAPLAAGTHNLRANATDVAANKSGFSPTQVLTVGAARPNPVVFAGTARTDLFTGGAGDDVFQFSTANLAATDRVNGRGGSDELLLTGAGTVHAAGVAGVELYLLGGGAPNTLFLTNANFAGVTGGAITVDGGNAGNT
ncbi:MAG TPA: Ig-like domain-containing protein, partial [Stellaceae bacterium]